MKRLHHDLLKGLLIAGTLFVGLTEVFAESLCTYQDEKGVFRQVQGIEAVPENAKSTASCFEQKIRKTDSRSAGIAPPLKPAEQSARGIRQKSQPQNSNVHLAHPSEIELEGTVRREQMNTPLGRVELRWPRSVELSFGRAPVRAMQDAAVAASRALRGTSFDPSVQSLRLEWQVVFMDQNLPEAQIPTYLKENCHPAWMTAPSQIYVVAERVVAGCGGQRKNSAVADATLAQILIHEIGHAVEFQLLGNTAVVDRMRAEGFASWFESYASDFSAVVPSGSVKRNYFELAHEARKVNPTRFDFGGGPGDYARASLYFHAVSSRRGVRGVMEMYRVMRAQRLSFLDAIKSTTGWNDARLEQELRTLLDDL